MPPSTQQVLMGVLAVVVGLSGWLLPDHWNPLRLRRSYARLVSEDVNRALPKVLGTLLAVLGLGLAMHGAGIL